jgi:hypothetical protein
VAAARRAPVPAAVTAVPAVVTAVTAKEFSSEELPSVSSHGLGPFQRGPGRFFGAARYDRSGVQPVVIPYPAIVTSDNEYYVNFCGENILDSSRDLP